MSDSKSIATVFAEWIADFDLTKAPSCVVRQAKRCLLDVFGVGLAGSETAIARTVRDLVLHDYAAGDCAVLGTASRVGAAGAAFANAVAAHALDFDDTCYSGIVHASAVVGPVALAVSQSVNATGGDFLAAYIAGVEVEYTLGKMVTGTLYNQGWFNTAVLGTVGAAAGAAKAIGLDAEKTSRALALAACQTAGLRVSFATEAKPYLAGLAAEKGVRAAILSRATVAIPPFAFEERRGFFNVLNNGTCKRDALEELGRMYVLDKPGVAFKRFPVCSAAQAAAEAVGEVLAEEGISADQVTKVRCEVTALVHISLTYDEPATVSQAQFSMPFAVGCILAYGDLAVAHLSDATLRDARLKTHMAKVEMERSLDWKDGAAATRDCPEGAIVHVTTSDGQTFTRFKCAAVGMPANPMSDRALEQKFRECAKTVLGSNSIERWLGRLWSLESQPAVSGLLDD